MSISNKTIPDFIRALASKEPVPGGGGASALLGALGAALGGMVGSLTVGKKKYASVEAEIMELNEKARRLQEEFIALIDRDAEVFEPLARAYGLPKDSPEQQAEKDRVMEAALKEACSVPMEIMEKCAQAIQVIEGFAAKGSRLALSDAGVGAAFCGAALEGASLNIYINTAAMKDRAYAGEVNRKTRELVSRYKALAERIFARVRDSLAG
jgi:formiminotetrahydrofolate cyclodeaminase